MKILFSNDDGICAEGLLTLVEAFRAGNELFVSAPSCQQSGVSRSMTLFDPLRAEPDDRFGPDVPAYAVSGTPVDCVRLGVGNLFPRPDMVVSGINIGPNLGTDTLYSGTVGAAHEAALLGIPSVAVSCCTFRPKHMETAARYAVLAVAYMRTHPMPFGTLLNVNVPDLPMEAIKGVKLVPIGIETYALQYVERKDPMGRPYYWPPRERTSDPAGLNTDNRWVTEGYVTLTPLTYDLTDYRQMDAMDLSGFLPEKG